MHSFIIEKLKPAFYHLLSTRMTKKTKIRKASAVTIPCEDRDDLNPFVIPLRRSIFPGLCRRLDWPPRKSDFAGKAADWP